MRFMMLVKGDKSYEDGAPPPPALMAAIGALGEEMVKSGHMLEMGGLAPSSAGALLNLEHGAVRVTDGPFAESKEAVGGFLQIEAATLDEAVAIAKTCPTLEYGITIEVRPVLDECPIFKRVKEQLALATA